MESPKAIALLAPLQDEIAPFIKVLGSPLRKGRLIEGQMGNRRVLLGKMGVGKKGVEAFFRDFPFEEVEGFLFMGCAGALQERVKAGDLFLCQPGLLWDGKDLHRQPLTYNHSWEEKIKENFPALSEGLAVTSSSILRNPEEKKQLGRLSQGDLVEMESFHLPKSLSSFRGPLLFLRVILDSLQQPLPDLGDFSEKERPSLPSLIKAFLLHPAQMIYLARTFPKVMGAMERTVREILPLL